MNYLLGSPISQFPGSGQLPYAQTALRAGVGGVYPQPELQPTSPGFGLSGTGMATFSLG